MGDRFKELKKKFQGKFIFKGDGELFEVYEIRLTCKGKKESCVIKCRFVDNPRVTISLDLVDIDNMEVMG